MVRFVNRNNDGFGSGFIFDTEGETGYVLTNAHVVDAWDDRVRVNVGDGPTQYKAVVLGTAEDVDLAVVWICCAERGFPILRLAGSATGVGTEIGVFGYPHDTTKMVPYWGEVLELFDEPQVVSGEGKASGWDIVVNTTLGPGSSGGPIVNSLVQVIGIHVGGVTHTPFSVATSVARVEEYKDQLYGSHVRGVSLFPQGPIDWGEGPRIDERGFLTLDVVIDTKSKFDPCGHDDSSCTANVQIRYTDGKIIGRIFPWETASGTGWVASRHNYYPAQGRFVVESSTVAELHPVAKFPDTVKVCIYSSDDGDSLDCAPLQAE